MIKITTKINEIENGKTIDKINETRSWFFKKINKIDEHLDRQTKKKREKTQITKIRNQSGEIITNSTDIKRIMRVL